MATPEAAMISFAPFRPGKEKWASYMVRFRQFLKGNNFRDLNDDRRLALFLAHCGSEVLEMAMDLVAPRDIEEMSWTDVQQILQDHYAPTSTPVANRFNFHQRNQKEGESMKDFVAALRKLAANCEFDNVDSAISDRIVFGMRDRGLQKKFLAKKKLVLKDVVEEAVAAEMSELAAAAMQKAKVHKIRRAPQSSSDDSTAESESDREMAVHKVTRPTRRENHQDGDRDERCASCRGHHPRASCRWRDATCRRCLKRGHIAEACRATDPAPDSPQPRNREIRKDTQRASKRSSGNRRRGDDDGYRSGAVHQTTIAHTDVDGAEKFHVTVHVEGAPCSMEVDSGSIYSIMAWQQIRKLNSNIKRSDLKPVRARLVDFGGNPIGVLGRAMVDVAYNGFKERLPITVVEHSRPNLLGVEWFKPLGLAIKGIHQIRREELDDIIEEFKEVFDGKLGKFVGKPISFNLDQTVTPIRLKPRRVPFALKPKVDEQLDKLIAQGILEPIDHAAWETPIVTPMKHDGSVRICADYKCSLNKALPQSAYPVPVVQHLLHSLGNGSIFAKLDLAQAYQQLPVDEKTAEAQTIVTHRGAFKCNRLQFGVSAAPGIFQSMMERLLQGVPGVVPYFDDVLISGESKAQLIERLRRVLQKFKEKGLRVRRDKCIIGVREVEFLGYLIDGTGIHPTKSKVKAIHEAPSPKNKAELQAFLGLLNFYSVFLKQKATIAEPLHRLLGKAAVWKWGSVEETAFRDIKKLLSSDSVLIQYHETLPLRLTCDASPYGVGAVLSHELPNGTEAPIAFFSKTMSSAERNYSQLDKEALAIVAGTKRFHEYLYGRSFTIVTDHKPLLGLLAGDKPTPTFMSPRMTRWAIFLAGYSYKLLHKPGTQIGNADALSRCPSSEPVEDPAPTTGIHNIDESKDCPVTSADVAAHTQKDPVLKQVRSWVLRGWPTEKQAEKFSPFVRKQPELSTMNGCLLWGDRVLIPSTLQKRTLEALHSGHPGIVRMKGLARSYVWWPSLDKDIEAWVARCDPCQAVRPAPAQSEPAEWETPSAPWSRVHIDFAGPMHGHHLLIVVDAFSKWLEVVPMASTTTEATIRALRRLFATHGLPDVLVSDNGPQLTSKPMEEFLAGRGIRHALSAPYRPAGNGQAERMVRTVKESLAKMGTGNWQEKIDDLLLAQHITPHASTRKCPAELLMGRRLRSPLDRLHPQYNPEVTATASRPLRAFAKGDPVFALNFHGSPKWLKGKIECSTGPKSYTVELEDGQVCRRHIDQLRKRWREVGQNQPGEVGLQPPDEVGLQHNCEAGQPQGGEAELWDRGEESQRHPDRAGQRSISNRQEPVDRYQGDEGTPNQPDGGIDLGAQTGDRQTADSWVDRGRRDEGIPSQLGEVGKRHSSRGDRQRQELVDRGQLIGEYTQRPCQVGSRYPDKENLVQQGGTANRQPDQVDQPRQPDRVGQRPPDKVDQRKQHEHQLPEPRRQGPGVHPGLSQPPAGGGQEVTSDLPGFRSCPRIRAGPSSRDILDPEQAEDRHDQRPEVRHPAGGEGKASSHSTAERSPSPERERSEATNTSTHLDGGNQLCLRRSARTSRQPAYLRDYVTYVDLK